MDGQLKVVGVRISTISKMVLEDRHLSVNRAASRNHTPDRSAHRDYRVAAVTDAVATLWPELQQACFETWQRKFARLRTTEQMVAEIKDLT